LRPASFQHEIFLGGPSSCLWIWKASSRAAAGEGHDMAINYLAFSCLLLLQSRGAEFGQILPLLTFYHLFPHLFAVGAVKFAMLLIASQFLCSFMGKYFYFMTGEMQI
jgi:hypothetical protein